MTDAVKYPNDTIVPFSPNWTEGLFNRSEFMTDTVNLFNYPWMEKL